MLGGCPMTLKDVSDPEHHGTRLRMTECPLCDAVFDEDYWQYAHHFADHTPDELGLEVAEHV